VRDDGDRVVFDVNNIMRDRAQFWKAGTAGFANDFEFGLRLGGVCLERAALTRRRSGIRNAGRSHRRGDKNYDGGFSNKHGTRSTRTAQVELGQHRLSFAAHIGN
jgi:hypothetical protein